MAHNLAYLDVQVPPGSRAAGVAISRARWHDEGDSHWAQRTLAIFDTLICGLQAAQRSPGSSHAS